MTRFWSAGVPILVALNRAGAPVRFLWEGRSYPVRECLDAWRVDVQWWQVRVWRDYYRLRTHDGVLVVVYHDLLNGEWRLQRVYD